MTARVRWALREGPALVSGARRDDRAARKPSVVFRHRAQPADGELNLMVVHPALPATGRRTEQGLTVVVGVRA